jgi:hypothetical protein
MERHVIEVATFMGQIKEAVINIKADINVLFEQNREIIKDITDLKQEIMGIKMKLFGIGVAGAALFELILIFIKKWIGK